MLQLIRTNSRHVTRIDAFISSCIRNLSERFSFYQCARTNETKTFIPSRMLQFLAVYTRPEAILHCCTHSMHNLLHDIRCSTVLLTFTVSDDAVLRNHATCFHLLFGRFLRHNLMWKFKIDQLDAGREVEKYNIVDCWKHDEQNKKQKKIECIYCAAIGCFICHWIIKV